MASNSTSLNMGQPRGSNGNPQQENIMKMIRQLQEDVNRQSEELLSLRQQNDEILKVDAQLKSDNSELQSQITELLAQNAALQRSNAQLQAISSQLEARNHDLMREIQRLQKQNLENYGLCCCFRYLFSSRTNNGNNRQPELGDDEDNDGEYFVNYNGNNGINNPEVGDDPADDNGRNGNDRLYFIHQRNQTQR